MYYRLELPWFGVEDYFLSPLKYRTATKIDNIKAHNLPFQLHAGEEICGLWLLREQDVASFWENEPPGNQENKSQLAVDMLKMYRSSGAGRLLVRIAPEAFADQVLLPDLPLSDRYATSCFHPRSYRREDLGNWNGLGTRLVPTVFVDDRYVEIFYGGLWIEKTPQNGEMIKEDILREGNMNKAVPSDGFADAPRGTYVPAWMNEVTPSHSGLTAGEGGILLGMKKWLRMTRNKR